jgi:hypothetical protein
LTSVLTFTLSNKINMLTSKSTGFRPLPRTWRFSGSSMASRKHHWRQSRHQSIPTRAALKTLTPRKMLMLTSSSLCHPLITPGPNKLQFLPMVAVVAILACARMDMGRGKRTHDACQKSLIPQSKIDRMTHIVLRDYTPDKYQKSTPAEKQKLWQLRNPRKSPGTEPTRRDRGAPSVASTSSSSTRKRLVEGPSQGGRAHWWLNSNCHIIALDHQQDKCPCKDNHENIWQPTPKRLLRP